LFSHVARKPVVTLTGCQQVGSAQLLGYHFAVREVDNCWHFCLY